MVVQGNGDQYSEIETNFNSRNVLLLSCPQLCREFAICMHRVAQDAAMRRGGSGRFWIGSAQQSAGDICYIA